MNGGAGDNFFEAGEGRDKFKGGGGEDTVSYAKSALAVEIDLLLNLGARGAIAKIEGAGPLTNYSFVVVPDL